MPADSTKLGSREIGKSREYISGMLKTVPETYADYQAFMAESDKATNPKVKQMNKNAADALFNKFNEQRTEIITRLSEVAEKVCKDGESLQKFLTPFLPYFKTQQEMVTEKQK